jgi:mRNA interferase MazF
MRLGGVCWCLKVANRARPVAISDILLVRLPQQLPAGVEQTGVRPAVVVGLPDRLGQQRFAMWMVVPITTQIGAWASRAPKLYPLYKAGTGGLRYDSTALLDHLRGVDLNRIVKQLGTLTPQEYAPIEEGLKRMMAR